MKRPFPDRRAPYRRQKQERLRRRQYTALTATSRELATGGLLCFNWAKASPAIAVAPVKAAESSA